jgi:cell division inhibitor SulA/protein ImuA
LASLSDMNPALHNLLQRPDIWRAKAGAALARPTLPSGWAAIDRVLHGGWPRGALIELLLEQTGSGELRLLMPLFNESKRDRRLQQVWIDPPLLPYAPALRQCGVSLDTILIVRPADRVEWLWACIQALRTGRHTAVLCWPNRHRLSYADLRQLQVTASDHGSQAFLLRDLALDRRILQHSTPAPLRLHLTPTATALHIAVLKQRGSAAGQTILLPHERALSTPSAPPQRARGAASTTKTPQPRAPRPAPPSARTEIRRL